MTNQKIQEIENKIAKIIGLNMMVEINVNNRVINSVFECNSEDLLKHLHEYRQLPHEKRQFSVTKFDEDPTDCLTYTLRFKKLHL
jgi:hypothetical protein